MAEPKYRPAIFISGGGSTMYNVLHATLPGNPLHRLVEPAIVITNNPEAGGIEKLELINEARSDIRLLPIPFAVVNRRLFGDEAGATAEILSLLQREGATGFIGCGYLKKFPQELIDAYPGFGHNQHPAMLVNGRGFGGHRFFGTTPHSAVLRYARKIQRPYQTHAVVHNVNSNYDEGDVVWFSEGVTVNREWTPEQLQQAVLPHEHRMVVEALGAAIAQAYLRSDNGARVFPKPPAIWENPEEEALFNQAMDEERAELGLSV